MGHADYDIVVAAVFVVDVVHFFDDNIGCYVVADHPNMLCSNSVL